MRELVQQADAVLFRFAHAENSAAADGDSRFAHVRDGSQAVFVDARGDDFSVELGRRIEIVIVGGEPRFLQALGLRFVEHAERATDFHIQSRDAAHHFEHAVEFFALGDLSPGRAHAESRGALGLGALRRREDVAGIHQFLAGHARFVVRALRAIGAIFRASAGFDRKQAAELDFFRRDEIRGARPAPGKSAREREARRCGGFLRGSSRDESASAKVPRGISKIAKSRTARR